MEESTADSTWKGASKRRKRRKRQVDRMTEEMRGLREAEVALIPNKECKEKLEGKLTVTANHICALTPGSYWVKDISNILYLQG